MHRPCTLRPRSGGTWGSLSSVTSGPQGQGRCWCRGPGGLDIWLWAETPLGASPKPWTALSFKSSNSLCWQVWAADPPSRSLDASSVTAAWTGMGVAFSPHSYPTTTSAWLSSSCCTVSVLWASLPSAWPRSIYHHLTNTGFLCPSPHCSLNLGSGCHSLLSL